MATVKITELPSITGTVADSTDLIPIVDVSSDVTSKITRDEFFKNIPGNVGIGIDAPVVKLDVRGNGLIARLSSVTSGDAYMRFEGTGTSVPFVGLLGGVGTFGTVGASPLTFMTAVTERMRIDATGIVSLPALTTETKSLEIGLGRTGDGISHVDLIGDATYGDYGARFIRNAGANGNTQINHKGTGALVVVTEESGPIALWTANAERMRIHASGGISIGNLTDPGATNLSVTGGIRSTGAQGIGYATGAGVAVTQLTSRTTATPTTGNKLSGAITLFTAAPALSTWFTFTVPNTAIAATDTVIVTVRSSTNTYVANVTSIVAATSFTISMASILGTASDTPIVNFSIIRGVAA